MLNNQEKKIQEQLRQNVELPEVVLESQRKAYRRIENGEITQEKETRSYTALRWLAGSAATAAAAVAVCFLLYRVNPVMATDLPLIGHLFERLEEQVSFRGDFSNRAVKLISEDDLSKEAVNGTESTEELSSNSKGTSEKTNNSFVQTDSGLTVSFSEAYANDQTIYLTMLVESEEDFEKNTETDFEPDFTIDYDKTYSFMPEKSAAELSDAVDLEGMFLDDRTYTAILRINLKEDARDYTEYQKKYDEMTREVLNEMGVSEDDLNDETDEGYALLEEYLDMVGARAGALQSYIRQIDTPETFDLHLEIHQLLLDGFLDEEEDASGNYRGNWSFDIPLTIDSSQTQVVEINETNELGIGLKTVTKTPYEISVEELYEEGSDSDCFMVALDANGNRLPYNDSDGDCNDFGIQDRDISTVDIFILDYTQYMDELKGEEYFNNNENKPVEEQWKTLLEANAKYHKTLHFQ